MTIKTAIKNDQGQGLCWPLLMPLALIVTLFLLRHDAGPFWQWNLMDPSYFYLLDALNILNVQLPGHLAHPGVPVYTLGAGVLRLLSPFTPVTDITDAVLNDPEAALKSISTLFFIINALMLWGVGFAALKIFKSVPAMIAVQLAPFVSGLILKRGFLTAPETLLIAATLVLLWITIWALDKDNLKNNRTRFAVLFGLSAGFTVAIKLTAAPIFVLPMLVLIKPRAIIIYGLTAGAAFLLFTIPAWGAYQEFFNFISDNVLRARSNAEFGAGSFGNISVLIKIYKRPVLLVPLLLSVFYLIVLGRRNDNWKCIFCSTEVRVVSGIILAQFFQALLVAKQPNAYYMIPSYMLSPLALVLILRRLAEIKPMRITGKRAGVVLLTIIVAVQISGVVRLDKELKLRFQASTAVDLSTYDRCARVYIYAASSRSFALYLADRVTGFRFTDRLKTVIPKNDYWLDDWLMNGQTLRNTNGIVDDPVRELSTYPCLYVRGTRPGGGDMFLETFFPGRPVEYGLSTAAEQIRTTGMNEKP